MSMFDIYIPKPALKCPDCGGELTGCQGNDGPCQLVVFEQRGVEPIGQSRGPTFHLADEELSKLRLPERFVFSCACRQCATRHLATGGTAPGSRWMWSVLGDQQTSKVVDAEPLDEDWRQCSSCCDAWTEASETVMATCPNCGALTRLLERANQDS